MLAIKTLSYSNQCSLLKSIYCNVKSSINMIQAAVVWFVVVFLMCWTTMHTSKHTSGVAIVQVVNLWLIVLAPTFTETNTLSFIQNVFEPNVLSISISLVCLLVAGVALGIFFQSNFERNDISQYTFVIVSAVAIIGYVSLVLFLLPVNIDKCNCLYGFYGDSCQQSCYDPTNGAICAGHGTCSSYSGCQCDPFFQGKTCNSCINEYNYDTNCTACRQGYSLTYQCTSCTTGRDPSTDCQDCLSGYLDDTTYNSPSLGCTVCKENFFRPSNDPRIGSYNKFLEFGDVCTECPKENNKICNGHGTCNHFLTPNPDAEFVYEGNVVLGQEANGVCNCDEGYYGPTCTKGLGFDGENTESICNGNGYVTTNFRRNIEDVFDTFVGLSCVCDELWIPAVGEDACSCKANLQGECTECSFGYFLNASNKCQVCPGGSFTAACNMKNAGGVCQGDGTCKCKVSYVSGGYTGEACETCVNNNFVQVGKQCVPCAGAYGDGFSEACGGQGVCITQGRLDSWSEGDTGPDSFTLYNTLAANPKSLVELQNYIGQCECFTGYSRNIFGTCT